MSSIHVLALSLLLVLISIINNIFIFFYLYYILFKEGSGCVTTQFVLPIFPPDIQGKMHRY